MSGDSAIIGRNPYGKVPKGESASAKKARQAKYYSYQRKHVLEAAQEGDSRARTEVSRIYGKLHKKVPSYIDPEKANKAALASVPFLAFPEGRAVKAAEGLGSRALAKVESSVGRNVGRHVPEGRRIVSASVRDTAPARKALNPARKMLTGAKTTAKKVS
ncbi:MAG: hypothetical protein ACREQ5_16965, partial [Candidatus Dormibacteria bacterium]